MNKIGLPPVQIVEGAENPQKARVGSWEGYHREVLCAL